MNNRTDLGSANYEMFNCADRTVSGAIECEWHGPLFDYWMVHILYDISLTVTNVAEWAKALKKGARFKLGEETFQVERIKTRRGNTLYLRAEKVRGYG